MTRPSLLYVSGPRATAPPDADLLVLGPSLGTTTAVWDLAVPALAERYRLVRFDLPGHGLSPAAHDSFSMAELADAVIALVESIGEVSFHYAGISMGGAIGIELALRHADRVRSLAVICSAAMIGSADGWRDRADLVRRDGTGSLVTASGERWYAPGFLDRAPAIAAPGLAALADVDDESYALCCEALAGFDARGRDIRVPLLAVAGELDVAVPVDRVRELGGHFEMIHGVGHLPSLEAPEVLVRLMCDHAKIGG